MTQNDVVAGWQKETLTILQHVPMAEGLRNTKHNTWR